MACLSSKKSFCNPWPEQRSRGCKCAHALAASTANEMRHACLSQWLPTRAAVCPWRVAGLPRGAMSSSSAGQRKRAREVDVVVTAAGASIEGGAIVPSPNDRPAGAAPSTFKVPGLIITNHKFRVPLDWSGQVGRSSSCRSSCLATQRSASHAHSAFSDAGPRRDRCVCA
jgi:hypothetical protein